MNDPAFCPACGARTQQVVFVEDGATVDMLRCTECMWDEYTEDFAESDDSHLCPNCNRYLTDHGDCLVCDYAW